MTDEQLQQRFAALSPDQQLRLADVVVKLGEFQDQVRGSRSMHCGMNRSSPTLKVIL